MSRLSIELGLLWHTLLGRDAFDPRVRRLENRKLDEAGADLELRCPACWGADYPGVTHVFGCPHQEDA